MFSKTLKTDDDYCTTKLLSNLVEFFRAAANNTPHLLSSNSYLTLVFSIRQDYFFTFLDFFEQIGQKSVSLSNTAAQDKH